MKTPQSRTALSSTVEYASIVLPVVVLCAGTVMIGCCYKPYRRRKRRKMQEEEDKIEKAEYNGVTISGINMTRSISDYLTCRIP